MSIETKHPDFLDKEDEYRVMRDTYAGQRQIKEATILYLPPTTGQVKDGALTNSTTALGRIAYDNYLARANFPDYVKEAVKTLVGVMHSEPAVIELPKAMEPMRKRATRDGESLQMLLRKINTQQLLYGRFGLLADFPQDPFQASQAEVPHIVTYAASSITNWDDSRFTDFSPNRLSFVVTNETVYVRGAEGIDAFDFMEEQRYRVFILEPEDADFEEGPFNPMVYKTYTDTDGMQSETIKPAFRGRALNDIPFVFIGASDLNPAPDEIPLLGLANLCLAIYRGDADYRQSLHMQGQDTLVIIGDEVTSSGDVKEEGQETEVGAGAIIRIAAGEGAKAEFIGVDSRGLPEQRSALEADKRAALSMGPRLLEPRGSQAESGDALRIRVSASTATLSTIANVGAAGLEEILKHCARWIGADPEDVRVRPNKDFTQESPSPELARALGEALKTGRVPLSQRAAHKWLQDKNFTKFTYDEEMKLIAAERAQELAFAQAPRFIGHTEKAKDHSHVYLIVKFPDGTVYGITDVVNDHFHLISNEEETEEAAGHKHVLAPAEATGNQTSTDPQVNDTPADQTADQAGDRQGAGAGQ